MISLLFLASPLKHIKEIHESKVAWGLGWDYIFWEENWGSSEATVEGAMKLIIEVGGAVFFKLIQYFKPV